MDYDPPPLNVSVSRPYLANELLRGVVATSSTASTGTNGRTRTRTVTASVSGDSVQKRTKRGWTPGSGVVQNANEPRPTSSEPRVTWATIASELRTNRNNTKFNESSNANNSIPSIEDVDRGTAAEIPQSTRVVMQGVQTKDFNYNSLNSKLPRNRQIDELDKRLRQEQESSRRLRSAVTILKGRLQAAEAGRRRCNAIERVFFSHLAESEALVLQRERLVRPGVDETRADCLEAARSEAHERLTLAILKGLEINHPNDPATTTKSGNASHKNSHGDDILIRKGSGVSGNGCWGSDELMHAYRSVSGGTIRRLSSALFGEELLSVEAARGATAEREKMLEERAKVLFEAQVSVQVEKDKLKSLKAAMKAEVNQAKAALSKAVEENEQRRDMVQDAERVRSTLSRRILAMQVARDELSETVGERLQRIRAAVFRRVGFLPRAVERSVNELVDLCSTATLDSPSLTQTEKSDSLLSGSFSSP